MFCRPLHSPSHPPFPMSPFGLFVLFLCVVFILLPDVRLCSVLSYVLWVSLDGDCVSLCCLCVLFINRIYFKTRWNLSSSPPRLRSACLFVLSSTFCFCGLQTHRSFVSLSWLQVCVYASAQVCVYALLSSNTSCMFQNQNKFIVI